VLKAMYNRKIFLYNLNRMVRKLPKKLQKRVTMTKKGKTERFKASSNYKDKEEILRTKILAPVR
jgi:hypothetical protein